MTFFRGLRQEWPLPGPSRRTCTPDEHGSSPGFRRESGAPVCVNNSGGGRISGVYTTHLSGAESITIHHGRLQYRRLFPVFLTVVQTETVNTGVNMPGKLLQYTNSLYPD